MLTTTDIEKAKAERNSAWETSEMIPSWVNVDKVKLDRFFTKPEIARRCYNDLLEHMSSNGNNLEDYVFVEPSAGNGAFADLLPNNSLALDI